MSFPDKHIPRLVGGDTYKQSWHQHSALPCAKNVQKWGQSALVGTEREEALGSGGCEAFRDGNTGASVLTHIGNLLHEDVVAGVSTGENRIHQGLGLQSNRYPIWKFAGHQLRLRK